MGTPDEVTVWVGLDVGKDKHFAVVLDDAGDELCARSVGNDESDIEALLVDARDHGAVGLVIDQPGSIAQLAIGIAARRDVPVAYVPWPGDAPGSGPLSGRSEDGPARRVRDR